MKCLKIIILALILAVLIYPEGNCAENETVSLPIVMYHHISNDPSKWNKYVISPEEFRSDMEYLSARGYESINFSQLLAWQNGEFDMPEKPFMISFDDGFTSTAAYAEPIMKEYGFTGIAAIIGSVCEEFSHNGENDAELSSLSWEEAGKMAERGVIELQCHTWNLHKNTSPIGCSKRKGESREAYRVRISSDLSKFLYACRKNGVETAISIAYPFGAYNEETANIVKDMGFLGAFTCTEEINILTGDSSQLYYLGRFNRPHGILSENFFKKWENNY